MMDELFAQSNLLSPGDVHWGRSSNVNSSFIIYIVLITIFIMLVAYCLINYKKTSFIYSTVYTILSICVGIALGSPYMINNHPIIGMIIILTTPIVVAALLYYRSLALSLTKQIRPAEDLSREREKIFQLLENGKINVPEAKELLNAIYEPLEKSIKKDNKDLYSHDEMYEEKPVEG